MQLIKEGMTKAIKIVNKNGGGSVAKFVIVKDDGDIYNVLNTVCSAGLRDYRQSGAKYIVSKLCLAYNTRKLKLEVVERFLDWIINRSPYRSAFVRCSGATAVQRGYTILRCDRDGNLVGSAATAARMCTEHYGQIAVVWDKLVAEGVNPNIAFLMAHYVQTNDHAYIKFDSPADGYWGWHSCIDGMLIDRDYIYNFMTATPIRTVGLYSKLGKYEVMCSMWQDYEGAGNEEIYKLVKPAITRLLNECHQEKPKEDRKINPFADNPNKAKKKYNGDGDIIAPVNDFIPLYANWIKENI